MGKASRLVLGCAWGLIACDGSAQTDDASGAGGSTTGASTTGVGVGTGGSGCGTSVGHELTPYGGEPDAVQIEADGTYVFWADTYGLNRSLPDGTDALALARDLGIGYDLAVAPGGIYLAGYSGITKLDKQGTVLGAVTTLMSVVTVAEDGDAVFFTRANEGGIYTAPSNPAGGGGGTALAGTEMIPPHAGGIVARDGFVYWASGSVLYRAPESGGSYEVLSEDASPKVWNGSVALTAELVVWIGQQSIYAKPIAGGDAFVVSDSSPPGWRIAVDQDAVYFASGNAIYRADFAGGGAALLDCFGDSTGDDIAVDDAYVYWLGGTHAQGRAMSSTYSLRVTPKL